MLSTSGDREENINAEDVAKKVKDAAKIIRETSSTARETEFQKLYTFLSCSKRVRFFFILYQTIFS